MTTPELGNVPIEDDPTGMRALLSSLPDPGPMPEDLSARILASLEHEARQSGAIGMWDEQSPQVPEVPPGPGASTLPDGHTAVSPLRRRRRRIGPLIGVAAALAVFAVGGGTVIKALLGGMSNSGASAQGSYSREAATGNSGPPPGVGGEDSSLDPGFALSDSGTAYQVTDLAGQATRLLKGQVAARGDAPSGRLADADAARACATALGAASGDSLLVDYGSLDGNRAVLLVAQSATGSARAWLVSDDCSPADARVLAGPVRLG